MKTEMFRYPLILGSTRRYAASIIDLISRSFADLSSPLCTLGLATLFLAFAIFCSPFLSAQGGTQGSIVGTVTDSTGSVVVGAKVTVTEMNKQTSVATVTTAHGDYTVPYLQPGRYKVSIQAAGFATQEVLDITLDIAQVVRKDFSLVPGRETQSVTVSAGALSLDTDSAAIGTEITGKEIVDLPLNGRNFQSLMVLGPTVTTNGDDSGGTAISIGGARSSSNYYTIDGITDIRLDNLNPLIYPSIDAIQEFKEQTKSYSAAYGSGATQIMLSTKGGTNSIHGTVFEFLRNDFLNAHGYVFPGHPVLPIAKERMNNFGYSAGFPVVIPHLYNGRNRTFFFANLEHFTSPGASQVQSTYPTTLEKQGLFTSVVYDPRTGLPFPKDSTGTYYQIPQDRFSTLAKATLNPPSGTHYLPDPDIPGTTQYQVNYQTILPSPSGSHQETYRVDQTIGNSDSLFGRFTLANNYGVTAGASAPQNISGTGLDYQFSIGETHTFSPHLVNDARFGWMYGNSDTASVPATAADQAATGLLNTYPLAGQGFPTISVSGYSAIGSHQSQPQYFGFRVWDMSDSITLIHGPHTITAGVQLKLNRIFSQLVTNIAGEYYFDNYAIGGTTTQDAFANFLLGRLGSEAPVISLPTAYTDPKHPFALHMQNLQFSPFVNDDWQLTRKLTVNAGLRYDFGSNPVEANNHFGWFDPNISGGGFYVTDKNLIKSGLGGSVYALASGRSGNSSRKWVFAPRLGFAYRLGKGNKDVIRAGYGIFYDQWDFVEIAQTTVYPYAYKPFVAPYSYTDGLWPAASPGPATPNDLPLFSPPTEYKRPYLQQYSLSTEHDFGHGTKLEVAYEGSVGTHLEGRSQLNQPLVASAGPGTWINRRPYTNFAGLLIVGGFGFSSNYNAGYVQLQHQSKDLALRAAYTWSKNLDVRSDSVTLGYDNGEWAGPMDSYHPRRDYGKSTMDLASVLTASGTYNLPFGRGELIGANMNRALDTVVGGWQLNAIWNWSDSPVTGVWALDADSYLGTYGQRANYAPANRKTGFHRGTGSTAQWWNIGTQTNPVFSQPDPGVFGNSQRNMMRGPGSFDIDASIFKNFKITERATFQFRTEAFNATNHVNFGLPDQHIWNLHWDANGNNIGNFGKVLSAGGGRELQFGGKVIF